MFELEKFFGGLIKGSGKKSNDGKSKKRFLSDSLKVSLLIAVIVILVIYLIFKDAIDEDENFFSLMFKAGLFVVAAIVSGVFLHSKHLEHVYEDKYSDKTSHETVKRGTSKDLDDVNVSELDSTSAETSAGTTQESSGERESYKGHGENGSNGPSSSDKPVQVNVNISGAHLPKSGAFEPPDDS